MSLTQQDITRLGSYFVSKQGGIVQGELTPDQDVTHDLGRSDQRWDTIYAETVIADNIQSGSGVGDADTVDGFDAAGNPIASTLLALDPQGVFPIEVYPEALLKDGSRALEDNLTVVAGATIDGIDIGSHTHTGVGSSGSKINHGDLLNLDADDHTQYAERAQDETITGDWMFTHLIDRSAGWLFLPDDKIFKAVPHNLVLKADENEASIGIGQFISSEYAIFLYDDNTPTTYIKVGRGNDSVTISGTDATYRFWAGHATAASAPFSVEKDGSIKAIDGEIAGWVIDSTSISKNDLVLHSTGYISAGTSDDLVRIDSQDATWRLWAGNAVAANAPFRVNKTGDLYIGSGYVSGVLRSTNFISGQSGFSLNSSGLAEFDQIIARGRLETTVFAEAAVSVASGKLIISDGAVLGADMASTDDYIIVDAPVFQQNDIVRLKPDATRDEWMQVTSPYTTDPDGYKYFVTRELNSGEGGYTGPYDFYAGESVVRLGSAEQTNLAYPLASGEEGGEYGEYQTGGSGATTGGGFLILEGSRQYGPYFGVAARYGPVYDQLLDVVRIGNLDGILDYVSEEWGAFFGDANAFMAYDQTQGLRIEFSGTGVDTSIDDTGISTETISIAKVTAPGAPTDPYGYLYHDTADNKLYWRYGGTVYDLTYGGTGPVDHGTLAGLDDDDHGAIYPGISQAETISGAWTFDDGVTIQNSADNTDYLQIQASGTEHTIDAYFNSAAAGSLSFPSGGGAEISGDLTVLSSLISVKGGSGAIAVVEANQIGTDHYGGFRTSRDGVEIWFIGFGPSDDSFRFRYNSSTDLVIIDTSGNVTLDGGYLEVAEIAAPGTPATGYGRIYEKTDGLLYFKDDAGTEYDLTGSSGVSAHQLGTSGGPHTGELPLADLAAGLQGSIIRRGGTDWEEYALGTQNYVLKAGATDVVWGQVAFSELTGDIAYSQLDSLVDTVGGGSANMISGATHVHTDADGSSKVDHGNLNGLGDDDHSQYLLASGARALTANWDAGAFQIRALTFYSDEATNPPFTVVSTAKVVNLNADLLDDQSGAYYLDSANFTGTDWTDLTDTGATTLHKHDHGGMDGLADDDHTIYFLADGTRDLTGNLTLDRNVSGDNQDLRRVNFQGRDSLAANQVYAYFEGKQILDDNGAEVGGIYVYVMDGGAFAGLLRINDEGLTLYDAAAGDAHTGDYALVFRGKDSLGAQQNYAWIRHHIVLDDNGSETGALQIAVAAGGSERLAYRFEENDLTIYSYSAATSHIKTATLTTGSPDLEIDPAGSLILDPGSGQADFQFTLQSNWDAGGVEIRAADLRADNLLITDTYIRLQEIATPANPANPYAHIWAESDGIIYGRTYTGGVERRMYNDEDIQDLVGAMVSGNTETHINVTYQDIDGTLDFEVDIASIESVLDHGNIQGLGDDDHTQYAEIANAESISGVWTFSAEPIFDIQLQIKGIAAPGAGPSGYGHLYAKTDGKLYWHYFGGTELDLTASGLWTDATTHLHPTDTSDGLTVGASTAPDGVFHVFEGSAGTVTADISADTAVLESSGDGGFSILTPDLNYGGVYFGSPSSNKGAWFSYKYNTVFSFEANSVPTIGFNTLTQNVDTHFGSQDEQYFLVIDAAENKAVIGQLTPDNDSILSITDDDWNTENAASLNEYTSVAIGALGADAATFNVSVIDYNGNAHIGLVVNAELDRAAFTWAARDTLMYSGQYEQQAQSDGFTHNWYVDLGVSWKSMLRAYYSETNQSIIVLNDNQLDVDVLMEGANEDVFLLDASVDAIILGAGDQDNAFDDGTDVRLMIRADGAAPNYTLGSIVENASNIIQHVSYGTSASYGSGYLARFARGSEGAPSAPNSGDRLGFFLFGSYDGSAWGNQAGFISYTTEAWSGTARGTKLELVATANSSTSRTTVATLQQGIQVGSPTGGDKGSGTINVATDIYKNNSAYNNPDYVLEHYWNGNIEQFKDNVGALDYQGLMTIPEVAKFTKEKFHLPWIDRNPSGMFERGDMILAGQESLMLYIIQLEERIRELEEAILH